MLYSVDERDVIEEKYGIINSASIWQFMALDHPLRSELEGKYEILRTGKIASRLSFDNDGGWI